MSVTASWIWPGDCCYTRVGPVRRALSGEYGLVSSLQPVAEQAIADDWQAKLSDFQKPSIRKATWQLLNTMVPYIALWIVMVVMLKEGVPYYWVLPLAVLAGGLLVRIFIFFHDCTHDCFFPSRRANRIVGYITGIMTFTPFDEWKHKHALHHAGSGNLEKRGTGDVWTMSIAEYEAASLRTKLTYRFYRHPLTLLVIGPPYIFLLNQRFSTRVTGERGRRSVLITNIALAIVATLATVFLGWDTYLKIQLPTMGVASLCGVWLFYVQHQYERPYWAHQPEWSPLAAALEGSSYYKLPKVLQWFSGNIGLHHIHHLRARIPNYNLQACYDSIPALQCVKPLTLFPSLKCLFLNLWDEEKQDLVSFRVARKRRLQASRQAA
jgi:omega-6 fatty acid desaturase (delta-12 desaturase)